MNKEYHEYYTRRKQEVGTLNGFNIDNWEEVPDEDLWEDGEIDENGLTLKLFQQIITEGEWKVIREIKGERR